MKTLYFFINFLLFSFATASFSLLYYKFYDNKKNIINRYQIFYISIISGLSISMVFSYLNIFKFLNITKIYLLYIGSSMVISVLSFYMMIKIIDQFIKGAEQYNKLKLYSIILLVNLAVVITVFILSDSKVSSIIMILTYLLTYLISLFIIYKQFIKIPDKFKKSVKKLFILPTFIFLILTFFEYAISFYYLSSLNYENFKNFNLSFLNYINLMHIIYIIIISEKFLLNLLAINCCDENSVDCAFLKKFKITSREKEIIQLIIQGHKYKEIAEILEISYKTVDNHVQHIYKKVGVNSKRKLLDLVVCKDQ